MHVKLNLEVSDLDWTSAVIAQEVSIDCALPGGDAPAERAEHICAHFTALGGSLTAALRAYVQNTTAEQMERGVTLPDDPLAKEVYDRNLAFAIRFIHQDQVSDGQMGALLDAIMGQLVNPAALGKPKKKGKKK